MDSIQRNQTRSRSEPLGGAYCQKDVTLAAEIARPYAEIHDAAREDGIEAKGSGLLNKFVALGTGVDEELGRPGRGDAR